MSNKIYVANISFDTTEDTLSNHFGKHGEVTSCKIITDRYTGKAKGFGFIEMESASQAQDAITALDGVELDTRALKVNEAKPQVPRDTHTAGNSW